MKELLNKHNQRSCPMKKSIQTVPYNTHSNPWNLKKFLAGVLLVAVPVFTSCEKDPVKPNDNNNQPQTRETKDIIYKQNINLDSATIQNYLSQNYDICFVPESKIIFSTLGPTPLRMTANKMRKYWGIAPDRISGKKSDTLYVTPEALDAGAASFWIDTLHNTVLPRQSNNQR